MSGKSTAVPRRLTSKGTVTGLNGPSNVDGIDKVERRCIRRKASERRNEFKAIDELLPYGSDEEEREGAIEAASSERERETQKVWDVVGGKSGEFQDS